MKSNSRRMLQGFAVAIVGAALVLLNSCRPGEEAPAPDAVARIGDYVITKAELKQRLAQEVRPRRDSYNLPRPPVTAEAVLKKMVAEQAIALEGRQLGYLDDEMLRSSVNRFRIRQLVQTYVTDYVMENVPVPEAEVEELVAADPNLSREQAEMRVRSKNAGPMMNAYYDQLLEKFNVEKLKENFPKASRIYQRLRTQPKEPRARSVFWVMNKQIRNELSDQEKQIVLARYTGGELTLYDWFDALGQIAPPGRPKDLNTAAGVEKLLDRALRPFIWEAEAVAHGYDQNEELLQKVRTREDMSVLGMARREKYKELLDPNDEEIKAFYDAHPEAFAKPASLKVEQVWCPDLETAEKARQMLTEGASFESVNGAHGLRQNQKPHSVYPGSEGVFWDDLYGAEPNDVVGPLRGFYEAGIKWRVVRILEKTPPEMSPYSDALKNQVQSALMTQRREKLMADYEAQMLAKHRYEVYADRIADIDPLEVTPVDESGR
ncbi:MAG: peptidyl-prolyl cis-trans isomerase [Phycisphaerales bacterium]|nr:MAG: peptidyl-prolyl cis-trans isomerase [Phycisphaerales bacterium]